MKKAAYIVAIVVAATVCVLVVALKTIGNRKTQAAVVERERLEQTVADLEQRIRQAGSQKDSAAQKISQLQEQVVALTQKRDEDRQVIQDLWTILVAETRRQRKENTGADKGAQGVKDGGEIAGRAQRTGVKYDVKAVKEMLASSGGNLDAAVHQIVTPKGIERILQEHAEEPAYWAAAASLAPDKEAALEYLKQALQLHPDSASVVAALVGAQIAAGQIDESTLAYVSKVEQLDPTNALGDCYAAYCQFQKGDVLGALRSLAQASAKGRFADDRIGMLMARYDCLLNEGVYDPVALGLSAFTLPLEHLGMIRQIEQQAVEQVRSLSAAGRNDDALKIAEDISNLGRTVSSSGRFLVHDRVGMALQQAGLSEQRQIYQALGDTGRIQEVDSKLQAVQQRSATIDTMARSFGAVMAKMTEDDLAGYVDGTILNGEFATLQSIPEIAQALQQAQSLPQQQAAQTTSSQK